MLKDWPIILVLVLSFLVTWSLFAMIEYPPRKGQPVTHHESEDGEGDGFPKKAALYYFLVM